MKRRLGQIPVLSLFVLLTVTLVGAGKPTKDAKDASDSPPNFYPLQVGNEWHFEVSAGGNMANMVSRIAKIESINGNDLARLEAEINGKTIATEHLRQTEKGVFRYRNNGMEVDPPICLLQYPVKTGAKWEGKLEVGKEKGAYTCETTEENVEVAAGKFKAIRVDLRLDTMGQIVNSSYWFVKDIGFVKQTVDAGNLKVLMELQKFLPKKAE